MSDIQKIADMMPDRDPDEFEEDYEDSVDYATQDMEEKIEFWDWHDHSLQYWLKWIDWAATEAKKEYRHDAVDEAAAAMKAKVEGILSLPNMGSTHTRTRAFEHPDDPSLPDDIHMSGQ